MLLHLSIQAEDFDVGVEMKRLAASGSDSGAIASFVGLCRSEGGRLAALELEHYPGMAEAEIARIAEIAGRRWPIDAMTIIHRHGRILPGGNIVLVMAASSHREAAFSAAQFAMDYLKTSAPFWKKEHRVDGISSAWVSAKDADDAALARWNEPS
jgi:molybdopterin synthase catalytic subunit